MDPNGNLTKRNELIKHEKKTPKLSNQNENENERYKQKNKTQQ